MWNKIKQSCLHSLTIAWSYVLLAGGTILDSVDTVGNAISSPDLRDQITTSFADPVVLGRCLLAISLINIASRLRTAGKNVLPQ